MPINDKGQEQCEVCRQWFYWWDLTCKTEGVWSISCCFPCSKREGYFERIVEVKPGQTKARVKTGLRMAQISLF